MRCFLRASNNEHRLYVIVIVVDLFRHFLAFPGLAQWKKEALELCSSWDKFFVFQLSENLRPTFEAKKILNRNQLGDIGNILNFKSWTLTWPWCFSFYP